MNTRMIDVFSRTTLMLLVSQILLDVGSGHPVVFRDGKDIVFILSYLLRFIGNTLTV